MADPRTHVELPQIDGRAAHSATGALRPARAFASQFRLHLSVVTVNFSDNDKAVYALYIVYNYKAFTKYTITENLQNM